MATPTKHKHSIRELAQAAIDLTATELVKGIGMVVSIAFPVVCSVIGGVWWLSAEFAHAQNKLDKTAESVAEIAAKMDKREADATAVHDRLTHVEDSVAWCCRANQPPKKPAGASPQDQTWNTSAAAPVVSATNL